MREWIRQSLLRRVRCDDSEGEPSTASGASGDDSAIDLLRGRVQAVVEALVEQGLVQVLAGEGAGEESDVKYRRVPPAPTLFPGQLAAHWGRGHPGGVANADRDRRLGSVMGDFGVLKPEDEEKQSQSVLEKEFDKFFGHVVSE